jgi:peptidoglycan/xylan/chitin deacetylase (PgdA/CDA1 family)
VTYRSAMPRFPRSLRRAVKGSIRLRSIQHLAFTAGARRGHGLTLLFHRISAAGPREHEIVRSVPLDVFRAQLDVLSSVGDVVPAAELARRPATGSRPRFALTFDDDYASQLLAARELHARGLPGTFFLSGRALHGLGAYWWEVLESRIAADGLAAAAASMGLAATTPQELAAWCEATAASVALAAEGDATPADHLSGDDITTMAALPGITVGFHTLHHRVLPALEPAEVDTALTLGRAELAAATGRPVDLLAYPHGKATDDVAAAAARAGFPLAWTGRIEPATAAAHPQLLARWEPHELPAEDFAVQLAVRLNFPDRGP